MGGPSLFTKILLLVAVLVLILGFILTVDAISELKVSHDALNDEIRVLRGDIQDLKKRPVVVSDAGGVTLPEQDGVGVGAEGSDFPEFANLETRDPDAVEGGGIVLAASAQASSINYILANESQVSDYWGWANDTLGTRNISDPDRFEPLLAKSWEISEDNLTYTIHLREGVLWHDFVDPVTGEEFRDVEVTAEDVKFYMDLIRNPEVPCEPMRNYYKDLDRIEILDPYTFKVVWKKPYFRSIDFTLGMMPLPRHFYRFEPGKVTEGFVENHQRNAMIVGCGRWVFQRWEKGKEIVFTRNERYYGPRPYMKRLMLKIIREPSAQLQALRNGGVDRIGLLPEQWVHQTSDDRFRQRFARFRYPRQVYYYIGYNMRKAPFDDRRVRLALTHLMNRERMIEDVLLGLGRIVTGSFYPDSSYYDRTIEPWPFDIERARELLAEAGWRDTDGDGILDKQGKPFEFSVLFSTSSKTFARVAEIWREDCGKAGVLVNINPIEWSVLMERADEWNFDAVMSGWSMPWESDPYQLWHGSQAKLRGSSNYVGFDHPEANQIIEAARPEFDLEKRTALYRRFHQILHEEQPYTFLFNSDALVAQDRRYRNARVYTLGMDIDSFWVPLREQKYRE